MPEVPRLRHQRHGDLLLQLRQDRVNSSPSLHRPLPGSHWPLLHRPAPDQAGEQRDEALDPGALQPAVRFQKILNTNAKPDESLNFVALIQDALTSNKSMASLDFFQL